VLHQQVLRLSKALSKTHEQLKDDKESHVELRQQMRVVKLEAEKEVERALRELVHEKEGHATKAKDMAALAQVPLSSLSSPASSLPLRSSGNISCAHAPFSSRSGPARRQRGTWSTSRQKCSAFGPSAPLHGSVLRLLLSQSRTKQLT
jgi:hypothetical protein